MPRPRELELWFLIADQDIRSAKLLMHEGLYTTAIYHCQQVAEKALKGYLACKGQEVQKTHDLIVLVKQCALYDPMFMTLISHVKILKPFSTRNRYPDDYVEIEEYEIGDAVKKAQYIFDFVKNKIK